MDERQPNLTTLFDTYPSHRPAISTGVDRRAAGPSLHEGLPPHLQPLPDSDEGESDVDVSRTVPLGSGSTQEWTGSQLYDRRGTKYKQSFTSLLHEGALEVECLPRVDLTFGLRSGSPSSATRTAIVNPHPDDDAGQVTLVGRGTRGGTAPQEMSEKTREWPTAQVTCGPLVPRSTGGCPQWMHLPSALPGGRDDVRRPVQRGVTYEDFPFEGAHGDGRRLWKESRQELRRQQEESITQGVQRLRVGEQPRKRTGLAGEVTRGQTLTKLSATLRTTTAVTCSRCMRRTWVAGAAEAGVRRAQRGGGRSRRQLLLMWKLRGRERVAEISGFNFNMDRAMYDEIKGAKERSHTISPTSVADTGGAGGVQLPSAQSATLKSVGDGDGGGDGNNEDDSSAWGGSQTTDSPAAFGKRKNVRQQTFEALTECMEKHGALMASTMESASKRQCETMESASKRQCSIQLRQCEALEAEVEVQKQHCTVSNESVRPPSSSVLVFSPMTNNRNSDKGKRGRDCQKTEVVGAMKRGRHQAKQPKASRGGALVIGRSAQEEWVTAASSGEDDDFETEEETFHGRKGTLREQSNKRMVSKKEGVDTGKDGVRGVACGRDDEGGGMEGRQARREGGTTVNAAVTGQPMMRDPTNDAQAVASGGGSSTGGGGEGGGDDRVNADDDDPTITRQRRSAGKEALEAKTRLWVDDLRFWNETEGHRMFTIIHEMRVHLLTIATGVRLPEIRKSIVLPDSTFPQQKLEDESELGAAKERAVRVQSITLRIINGWIFKSLCRARGYHCSYDYVLNHVATDIARTIWYGEDRRVCVSPTIVHNTFDLQMKLSIWYVGGVIHDRHEDDEMALYQESTTQHLVGAFTKTVDMGEGVDGGRISYDRLRNVADCMCLLLSAAILIMRMAGDNLRWHYEASYLVELIAKPTLIASLHRSFDARRHVLQCVNAVTEKMGKPPMALVDPPVYIPEWVSCGVTFYNDTTLTSPEHARRLDWLGTGPPDIDDEDEEKDGGGDS
ncbi:hypothetical protein CBR_g21162 [Chara braunii]|uniref:Uncharacterized protein n=1 Tax=Chara braunii TaxID=69332 RepID=A0A388L0T8_CHABU|nr:hypothetical protein CBR_g21162 [Chara braunii]|eukprot:GBG75920.1 hypothetical protein CBR_g21162 [Chara braunii]